MKTKLLKRLIPALALAACTVGLLFAAAAADVPTVEEVKSGVSVYTCAKGEIDYSNIAEGFISVKYTGGKDVRIKVQITRDKGTTYTYDLNNKGDTEVLPLTEGDGD